jgi:hypothetical protein
MECTKDQPGSYSAMLKELAKLDNTVPTKRVTYPSIEVARKHVKGVWVKFTDMIFSINHQEIYCTGVEMKQGVKTLIFTNFEMPVSEYTKPVSTIVSKSMKDYITQPKKAGSYKNCEGGGWYSMANLYELNGKFYTDAY